MNITPKHTITISLPPYPPYFERMRFRSLSLFSVISLVALQEIQLKVCMHVTVTDVRAVTSRLQPVKTYRAGCKPVHMITGTDVIQRLSPPEAMSLNLLADYMCMGKGKTSAQTREKLGELAGLVDRPATSTLNQVTSAWSLLTKG